MINVTATTPYATWPPYWANLPVAPVTPAYASGYAPLEPRASTPASGCMLRKRSV